MSLESQLQAGYVAIIFLWCSMSLYAYASFRHSMHDTLKKYRHNRYKHRLTILHIIATIVFAPVSLWVEWVIYELESDGTDDL